MAVRLDLAGSRGTLSLAGLDANAGGHRGHGVVKIRVPSTTSYRGRNSRVNLPLLTAFVLVALGVGAVGAVFSPGFSPVAMHWYAGLAKPGWLPPPGWFGPIWMVLYVLMSTAAYMVSRERYHRAHLPAM